MTRELLFSVTPADCEVQTFAAGGPGGQNQNKRHTAVRFIHPPSGARGESREHRTQLQNKKAAWRRMCETKEFKTWVRIRSGQVEVAEVAVDRMMWPVNIKTEVRDKDQWVEV